CDMFNAGRRVDRSLDDAGDAGVDDVRIGADQIGRDRQYREFDEREAVDADALIADQAQQHEQTRQHPRQHMAFDGNLWKYHVPALSSPLAAFRMVTSAWSVRKAAPSTATTSPASTPSMISTLPSCRSPVLTTLCSARLSRIT